MMMHVLISGNQGNLYSNQKDNDTLNMTSVQTWWDEGFLEDIFLINVIIKNLQQKKKSIRF